MFHDHASQSDSFKPTATAEEFGTVPNAAEDGGTIPHAAETVGSVPRAAEDFSNLRRAAEMSPPPGWRESFTLTVREVARLFEAANVARSERSIVNWCQPNRQGIARLDAYYDPNERRYFITRQSVDTIIAEEKARAAKANAEPLPTPLPDSKAAANTRAEAFRMPPPSAHSSHSSPDSDDVAELRRENLDLKISNRGKDYFIGQLKSERETLLNQLVESSQRVGQLETRLLQLESPLSNTRE